MKKFFQFFILLWLVCPVVIQAQHVTEYRPAMNLVTTSVVNLESMRGSSALDSANGFTRSVNTIQEFAGAAVNDVWFLTTNNTGGVVNSFRYGGAGYDDRSSAIETCPNGDYILLNITKYGGFDRIWAMRITPAGAIVWTFHYYINNFHVRGYCIKKTNDVNESYIIAGTTSLVNGVNPDKILLALKIDAAGNMLWNNTYVDPVANNNVFDLPKSMLVYGNTHIIAGNRTRAAARDIFTIAIDQAAGAIAIPYSYIDNGNRVDQNPYINFRNGGGFVLVYSTVANIGMVNTSRVAFTPLTAALAPAANTVLYWEANALNNYGHTIYPGPGAMNYDIGGGTTLNNLQNPTFFSITNTGVIVAGSYRRLWDTQNFTSTFMLRDLVTAPPAANGYAHHNYRPGNNMNGMSIMRDNSFCFVSPVLSSQTVANTRVSRDLVLANPLTRMGYPPLKIEQKGAFNSCSGAMGTFRKPVANFTEEQVIAAGFKVYPTIAGPGADINIEVEARERTLAVVNIYDMEGRLTKRQQQNLEKGANQFTANVATLTRGSYIVEIVTGSERQRARFVKQ